MSAWELDEYLKESCRSYQGCRVKNSARRNSLQKKTLVVERERKISTGQHDKEEKQMRQQLKQLHIDQKINSIVQNIKEEFCKPNLEEEKPKERKIAIALVNPYPITFRDICTSPKKERKKSVEQKAKTFVHTHGRRQSKEFEDLALNTRTGTLRLQVVEKTQSSTAKVQRKISDSTKKSLGELRKIIDPEGSPTIRRSKKSIDQQHKESFLIKFQSEINRQH